MSGALLDTSAVIAPPEGVDHSPGTIAVSVVTLGELHAGTLCAPNGDERERREEGLEGVYALFEPLPIDVNVAAHYGEAVARARSEGRTQKATDLLIIATAAATGRTLVTRDRKQAALARSLGLEVLEPA